jgi:hypothetical protein
MAKKKEIKSQKPIAIMEGEEKEDSWEIDSACETLMRAEEIKKDEDLMEKVNKKLKKKMGSIKSVADLISARNKFGKEEMDDEEL